jgi:hypothetical protein
MTAEWLAILELLGQHPRWLKLYRSLKAQRSGRTVRTLAFRSRGTFRSIPVFTPPLRYRPFAGFDESAYIRVAERSNVIAPTY